MYHLFEGRLVYSHEFGTKEKKATKIQEILITLKT
jgi:hypothetical protein